MPGIRCWRPAPPPPDQFYRPLLASVEMSRAKKASACPRAATQINYPCPQCGCGCTMNGKPAGMAWSNTLCCPGNKTGCCGLGKECISEPRLLGQGPCDPPCFSKFVFPTYAPFVPEPKFQMGLGPGFVLDTCGLAPCGGTSMYGAFARSCFSCNNCGSCGNCCGITDVSARPMMGANNAGCGCGRCEGGCCGVGAPNLGRQQDGCCNF